MENKEVNISEYEYSFSYSNKIARLLWNVVYVVLFRPFGSRLLKKWRVLVLKFFGAKIEWTSHIYASVKIWAPWNLKMGAYTTLGPSVDCYNQGKITIGANTTISQKAYLCASSHDISDIHNNLILQPITIKNQVWVAAEAFIGPGVIIGEGAVVGARSAVFKDVEGWTVVGGNPAKFIKNRELN
jgi:putative colanic acid biosynthesis acetyltransferase WcaF